MKIQYKKSLQNALHTGVALAMPFVIILSATLFFAYNQHFYVSEFQRYNLDQYVGISMNDMETVAGELIAYIDGKRSNLNDVPVRYQGQIRSFFNQREKAHMEDVVILFDTVKILRNSCLFIILFYSIGFGRRRENLPVLLKAYGFGGLVSVLTCGLLVALTTLNFDQYFTLFHQMSFSNDLWLLNPKTDLLIRMLPLEFFIDIVTRIVLWSAVIGVSIACTGFIGGWRIRKALGRTTC